MDELKDMTHEKWISLSLRERHRIRRPMWSPQLVGKEGLRVEVVDKRGDKRRFWVGTSRGWMPVHLEIKTSRSCGGGPADLEYQSVRVLTK